VERYRLVFGVLGLVGCLFDAVRDPAGLLNAEGQADMRFWVLPDDLDADFAGAVADLECGWAEVDRRFGLFVYPMLIACSLLCVCRSRFVSYPS
jgi:hypothetical protein